MNSRCRIHRTRGHLDRFPLALFCVASLLVLASDRVRAEPVVEVITQNSGTGRSDLIVPLRITLDVQTSYDDNPTPGGNTGGSLVTIENITLAYDRLGERTQVHLLTSAGFTHFFDATDTGNGLNANVTLSLAHAYSTRLSFAADLSASYQAEPDFRFDVGPERVRANHFVTADRLAATYHWSSRFATITSYTFERIKYDDLAIGLFQDRVQNTFGEVFQFSRSSRTNLLGEYRFEMIDYDTALNSSVTHYLLAGLEHKLTEHWILNARGGETFRSYDVGMDTVDPYVEGSVRYEGPGRALNWTASYGTEEPNIPGALARTTFRTGVELTYGLSARISSTAAVYYHHDENEGLMSFITGSGEAQDTFNLSLSLRYTINQHFALHVDYNHSSIVSAGAMPGTIPGLIPDYSRNRYSVGLTFNY